MRHDFTARRLWRRISLDNLQNQSCGLYGCEGFILWATECKHSRSFRIFIILPIWGAPFRQSASYPFQLASLKGCVFRCTYWHALSLSFQHNWVTLLLPSLRVNYSVAKIVTEAPANQVPLLTILDFHLKSCPLNCNRSENVYSNSWGR